MIITDSTAGVNACFNTHVLSLPSSSDLTNITTSIFVFIIIFTILFFFFSFSWILMQQCARACLCQHAQSVQQSLGHAITWKYILISAFRWVLHDFCFNCVYETNNHLRHGWVWRVEITVYQYSTLACILFFLFLWVYIHFFPINLYVYFYILIK